MPKITIADLKPDAANQLRHEDLVRITGGQGSGDPIPTESIYFNFKSRPKRMAGDWNGDGRTEGND